MMIPSRFILFFLLVVLAVPAMTQESRLGTFQAHVVVSGEAQTARQTNSMSVTVAGVDGNPRYAIVRPLAFDVGPPAVAVFESGACVLLDSFHGNLDFYGPDGTHLRTARISKEISPELERQTPFAVHDRTITLAVAEPQSSSVQILRFSDEGDQLFNGTLPGQFATGVVISHGGTVCAVGTARWQGEEFHETTALISEDGLTRQTVDIGLTHGAFSEDDQIVCTWAKPTQALIDVSTGSVISRATIGPEELLLDIRFSEGRFYLLTAEAPTLSGTGWVYRDPSVIAVSLGGMREEILTEGGRTFSNARLRTRQGALELEVDGSFQRVP